MYMPKGIHYHILPGRYISDWNPLENGCCIFWSVASYACVIPCCVVFLCCGASLNCSSLKAILCLITPGSNLAQIQGTSKVMASHYCSLLCLKEDKNPSLNLMLHRYTNFLAFMHFSFRAIWKRQSTNMNI